MELDVTQCIGCRKGIGLFIKDKDKKFIHLDLFATPEAGESYTCTNQKEIKKHLKKNGNKGTYLADGELAEFYEKQDAWWYDFIELASNTFEDNDELNKFFNAGEQGDKVWNQPNNIMEGVLLKVADGKNIEITKEDYPDLLKWNHEKTN
jgi:hypothetical protein